MANQKVTQLPSLSAASGNTLIYVVDVSDPTDDPSGSSKQITRDDVLKNITGLTADTISATTYQNLPTDIRVTGGTYSNGTATFTNNTGGTFTVTGFTASTSYTTNYIDFNTGATVTAQYGRLYWDSGTGTLSVGIGDSGTGLIDFQVGQEEVVRVHNEEATTLVKGEIVYVFGSQGNRPSVKRAIATGDGYSVTTLGMVAGNITSGGEGYVTTFGIVSNLNTLGLTGGTAIWLSPTVAGGYTETKPQAPYHTVLIGYVVRVSATVGSIFVNISNGWELDELHDVRISGATEGDLLMRSSYSGSPVWVNTKTLNGSYTITGNTNVGGNLNVTGNTVINSFTAGTGNINGDLNVTGNTTLDGLTANTISATTYQNLPIDPDTYVTAFTYNDNVFTISQNNGQPDLTAIIDTVTGWTVNGNLVVTGNTTVGGNLTVTGNTGINRFSSNTTTDLVRITQTGSGNALVVEDSTNPDGTPFVVNNVGRVGIGAQPNTTARLRVYPEYLTDYYGIYVDGLPTVGVQANGLSTGVYGTSPVIGGYFIASNNSSTIYGVQGLAILNDAEQPLNIVAIGGLFKVDPGTATSQYAVQLMDTTEGVGKVLVSQTSDGKANWSSSLSGLTSINTGTLTVTGNTSLQAFTGTTGTINGNLTVTAKTQTLNLQMTSGATAGYVLKSLDSSGNAFWEPIRITNTATTTNATITTLATINTIPDNATSYIEVYVKAYQTSATNWGIWKRTLTVTKVSGTVTIQEKNADVDKQSSGLSATSVSFSGTSGNVLVQVTGIAATNIDWKSAHEIIL